MTHISTFNVSNTLFNQAQLLQSNYAAVNEQSASGLISPTFDGISSSAQQLLSDNSQANNLTAQALVIKAGQTRINGLQNIMGTIANTLNSANALLTSVQGNIDVTGGASANVEQATTILNELQSLLNSQVGGKYLFGGSVDDTAPVNLSDPSYTPTSSPTTADTNYYQGNDNIESVRTSDSLTVSYGVTADNPAFEQAIRGLTLFIANPTDPTTITSAFNLIKSASDGVGNIVGNLTAQSGVVTNAATVNTATSGYLTQVISGLRDADTAAAAVSASQIDTQLQASYSSLSKLLNLRLSDYLK